MSWCENARSTSAQMVRMIVSVALLSTLASCAKKEPTVATIGDHVAITVDQLAHFAATRPVPPGAPPDSIKLRYAALSDLIDQKLLVWGAYEAHLDKDSTVLKPLDARKEQYYLATLAELEITQKTNVNDGEIEAYYKKTGEEVHAKHILIPDSAKAFEVAAQITRGANWDSLCKLYSADPGSKDKGGDLGFFRWGAMVKDFQTAAFALKTGETSPPTKTRFGWHIIRVVERRPVTLQPLDDKAREMLKRQIEQQRRQELAEAYQDKVFQKMHFEWNAATLKAVVDRVNSSSRNPQTPSDPAGQPPPMTFPPNELALTLATWDGGDAKVEKVASALAQRAPHGGQTLTQAQVEEMIRGALRKDMLLADAHSRKLENQPYYQKEFTKDLEEALNRQFKQTLWKDLRVDSNEALAYYQSHPDEFKTPEMITCSEVNVATEAKAKIVLAKVQHGVKFEVLVKDSAIGHMRAFTKDKKGELGPFPRSRYPELFDAFTSSKIGTVVGPVALKGGSFSVAKLSERTPEKMRDYHDVAPSIVGKLLAKKKDDALHDWTVASRAKAPITIDSANVLKSFQVVIEDAH